LTVYCPVPGTTPSSTTPSGTPTPVPRSEGLSGGIVAAIIIVILLVVVLVGAVVIVVVVLWRKRSGENYNYYTVCTVNYYESVRELIFRLTSTLNTVEPLLKDTSEVRTPP